MKTARYVALLLGAAGLALVSLAGERTYSQQGNDPNAYPNPYRMQENWAKLPAGRKWGSTIGVDIDPDGKSLWTFDRCAANNCRNSALAPIMKFDPTGEMQIAFGIGTVNDPHGFHVDRDGNVWVSDTVGIGAKGQTVTKFSKDGKILMTLGTPGVGGFLWQEYNSLIYAHILLAILTIGFVGFCLDRLMGFAESRLRTI